MNIRDYLKEKRLLCDGAFGTYFAEKAQKAGDKACEDIRLPERANLRNPDIVRQIHKEYIQAGARLIRTNTFASNTEALACTREELARNLHQAVLLAREAVQESGVDEEVFLAADIGPVQPLQGAGMQFDHIAEYRYLCERFLEEGISILLFETLSDYREVLEALSSFQKEKNDIFVIMQFSINQHGYTNVGISARRILEEVGASELVDAVGFNCGVGPGHMLQIVEGLKLPENKFFAVLPNASDPKIQQDRIIFMENQEYFAEKMTEMSKMGVHILGGCCGTNPSYIRRTAEKIDFSVPPARQKLPKLQITETKRRKDSSFYAGKQAGEKLIAVEIAPPFHADDQKIMDASNYLATHHADVVTFPDSPSGRTRADSVMMGIKVAGSTGMCVMPHICCRDKNAIAIRAQLLGAYLNGVRNLLVITGDPIPSVMRGDVRSVFQFESVGLMKIIQEMNGEEFAQDPITYGGALNHNRRNLDVEIRRMRQKLEAGASFFLTQPAFTKEETDRIRYVKEQVPEARILCGIMPLVSKKNAVFIRNEMTGIQVTEETVERYREDMSREEGEAVGVEIAREVMDRTSDFAEGYYFSIPFNRVYLLESIFHKK